MKMCLKSCFEILVVRENQDRIETLEIRFVFLPSLYWRGAAGGQNLFTILQTENGRLVTSGEPLELTKAAQSSPHIMTNATKERWQLIVAGNSHLRGTEAPICWPDAISGEVFCLPGACIRDNTMRLPSPPLSAISHCCFFYSILHFSSRYFCTAMYFFPNVRLLSFAS